MNRVSYGVFLDRERLDQSRGRPSKYAKIVWEFMSASAPQAEIEYANPAEAHNATAGFRMYMETHKVSATAHLHGSCVVLAKK